MRQSAVAMALASGLRSPRVLAAVLWGLTFAWSPQNTLAAERLFRK